MPAEVTEAPQYNPLALIQSAIDRGMDPDKLGKLLDLQERWEKSRAAEAFGAALARFGQEMPAVYKRRMAEDRKNNRDLYRFASLDDVMLAAAPVMARCGISVSFDTRIGANNVLDVTCRVRVGSHYEDKTFSCPVPQMALLSDPQKYGAALSYAKRYAVCAALNIVCTDIDDDAAGLLEFIDAGQVAQIKEIIDEKCLDEKAFLAWIGAPSVERIHKNQFPKAMDGLKRSRGRDSR